MLGSLLYLRCLATGHTVALFARIKRAGWRYATVSHISTCYTHIALQQGAALHFSKAPHRTCYRVAWINASRDNPHVLFSSPTFTRNLQAALAQQPQAHLI